MMTVPMDKFSAPSTREHVQRLLNKNIELENGLRMAAKAKIPSDPNAWLQMRENYETVILEDHDFSESHEIEYALWQLHYRRIEEFRAHINSASASAGSATSQGGKGVARLDRIKKIRSVFKSFLSEATGFYHDLILKIRAKYGLPLGHFSEGPENQIILAKDEKKSAEVKKGLISCHRCLIYLGDLARYKGLYGEGDSVTRDYAAASSYYTQAASVWPSSGNPHHQLAILASYSGDELVAVYRYFRSLAVDIPFSTARDNLIIAFEKNRQSYCQLLGDAKTSSTKTVSGRMNGRGRGRGESRLAAKDGATESPTVKEKVIPEIYKAFCIRFVRLNGILFTRTSMETFAEIFSLVVCDLNDLLSSGPDEELNFGSDDAENGIFVVRIITILIFTVHNVNRESEGQSYAEILQRSVLLQNAFTAAFEIAGHILKRSLQLKDMLSSYLLPAILVFIEWLACHPDIAAGGDAEDKQAATRSFFWTQCISFLNKLILSGVVSINGDEDEACFSDMSRYDEGETANRLALWEDFELRGFSPLLPAQLILDFSRKISFGTDGGGKERRARAQRVVAAGRVLMNVIQIDKQRVYFDPKLKRFAVGIEPQQMSQEDIISATDVPISDGIKHGIPVEKSRNMRTMQSTRQVYMEGEEEDEVIVFKPTVAEKHADVSVLKTTVEVLNPVENSFRGELASYSGAFSASLSDPQMEAAISSGNSRPNMPLTNTVPLPFQLNSNAPKWAMEQQTLLTDGLRNLSVVGNGIPPKAELQEGMSISQSLAFSNPFSLPASLTSGGMLSGPTGVPEPCIPSKFDSIMPPGTIANGQTMMPLNLPTVSKKSPVSRPVRHLGPPPGFNPVPSKQPNDSVVGLPLKNEPPLMDDYTWLDGYRLPPSNGVEPNKSLNHMNNMYSYVAGNSNNSTGMMNFPFPGKQAPAVQAQVESPKRQLDYQLLEHLKLSKEQQFQQIQQGMQQSGPLQEQYQGQSLWSGRFFV